jgi:hypothetical protein
MIVLVFRFFLTVFFPPPRFRNTSSIVSDPHPWQVLWSIHAHHFNVFSRRWSSKSETIYERLADHFILPASRSLDPYPTSLCE